MSGHWWCQHCNQELSSREVTFEENHDDCGGTAIWIEEEDIDEVEFLKRQLAEASERVDELYQENMVLKADMESNKKEYCACQKERDELQAQVAVLRGALEEANYWLNESGNDVGDGSVIVQVDNALDATPAEAAERVQKLVEALEFVSKEMSGVISEPGKLKWCRDKDWLMLIADKTLKALSEWRRDKCSS